MRRKAIAIAVTQEHSQAAFAASLKDALGALLYFMYGTPERTRLTLWFAFALALLGTVLNVTDSPALQVCPA